jgi:hypothetical protein
MRPLAIVLAAALIPAAAPALAQQVPNFRPGDLVDFYSFGKWIPCTIAAPLTAGTYSVHCGSIDLRAKPDPRELRIHVIPPPGVQLAFGFQTAPAPPTPTLTETAGARFGTRDPRLCNRRPTRLAAEEAKEIFICDAEHEFDGSLFLVTEVQLDLFPPRPFDPALDARKPGIDRAAQVVDIRATYNDFQCSPLPATHLDNPNNRNCNQFRATNAPGSCFKNTGGDWHCLPTESSVAAMTSTAKNVGPPTLVE